MQATVNGEPADVDITMKRIGDGTTRTEDMYVNDMRVIRVTHSHADHVPVVLVVEGDGVVEVDREAFYTTDGVNADWQPGEQPGGPGMT
jgi:hypothetical protein